MVEISCVDAAPVSTDLWRSRAGSPDSPNGSSFSGGFGLRDSGRIVVGVGLEHVAGRPGVQHCGPSKPRAAATYLCADVTQSVVAASLHSAGAA